MGPEEVRTAKGGKKLTMCSAYDGLTARWVAGAGISLILVGRAPLETGEADPGAAVARARAVARQAGDALVVAPLPRGAQAPQEVLGAAERLIHQGGAGAVALFGGGGEIVGLGEAHHIPFAGYLAGAELGEKQAMDAARAHEAAGAFALILELFPASLASAVTEAVGIPTLGLGSGPSCDGQVQLIEELLGLLPVAPRRAKVYARLGNVAGVSLERFRQEVEMGHFPSPKQTFDAGRGDAGAP